MRCRRQSRVVPLAAALLLHTGWISHAHASTLSFGNVEAPKVQVNSAVSLRDAIQGGAKHILLTDHIDAREVLSSDAHNSTFLLVDSVIIQGQCAGSPPDAFGPFSPPLLPLQAHQCVVVSDTTLFEVLASSPAFATAADGGLPVAVSLSNLYLRLQRVAPGPGSDDPLVGIANAALWMTRVILQGDTGDAVALTLVEDAQVFVGDSTINGFHSGVAPVAILERNSSLALDGCTISDNVNTELLAAVYASAVKADTPSAVVLRRSSLSGNPAPFFGAWLPDSASFYSDDEDTGVLRVGSASTVPAQPLSSLGEEQTAVVLIAAGNPLVPSRGDRTSTDDPDGGVQAEVAAAPRGGLRFGQSDSTSGFTIGESSPGSGPGGDDGTTTAVASLPGPVSLSTDSNNPSQVPEASAATVGAEGAGEEAENSLITALVATFAVLVISLVVMLAIVAVMSTLRRCRKKEWLKYSEADLMANSDAAVDHRATVGLPESTRFADKPGSAAKKAAASFTLPGAHMLVANATYDPQLSPSAATTARSAAQYALQADVDSEPWEGGFGAQCTASDRAVFADPGAPAGSGGMPGEGGGVPVVQSIRTDSDSDSSSLDFDMRGMNTFREMSTDLPATS